MHEVTVAAETLAKLIAAAKANGLDLGLAPDGSEIGDLKPVMAAVNLNRAPSEIAHETGANLKTSGLYLYKERLVVIKPDGTPDVMDVDLFRTWIDQFQLNFYKRRMIGEGEDKKLGPPIKAMLKKDVANVMLRSNDLRCHLPEIQKILPVRLPVWEKDEDGNKRIRLLPYGYDQATGIYTHNSGIEYLEMWDLERAVAYLRDLLKDFPFGDVGRSLAVQIAAMLTVYCQLLFEPLVKFPMIFFNANREGSGKSRLAEFCIYPVYGEADSLTFADNDEFTKKLDTWAKKGVAYTFLDDVSGYVDNNDLNRWLTSPKWSIRKMHSQDDQSFLNQTLTALTGNQATLSKDLTRRMLMVDLFSPELAKDRQSKLSMTIDQEWLAAPENRGNMLSALYALVRNWTEAHACKRYEKAIPSFEGWSRMIPAIVTAAGFDCPLQEPNVLDAGGKQEVEFSRLLEVAVRDYTPTKGKPVDILLTDWCRLARWIGVYYELVSDTITMREVMDNSPKLYKPVKDKLGVERQLTDEDKNYQASRYMDKSQSTKFGTMLFKSYRGAIRTIHGKRYKFADRESRHSTYAIEWLADETPGEDPPPVVEDVSAPADALPPAMPEPPDSDDDEDERGPF
ncbi:MAG: hypothetical protein ABIT37_03765 [Luteolibacter sp.]